MEASLTQCRLTLASVRGQPGPQTELPSDGQGGRPRGSKGPPSHAFTRLGALPWCSLRVALGDLCRPELDGRVAAAFTWPECGCCTQLGVGVAVLPSQQPAPNSPAQKGSRGLSGLASCCRGPCVHVCRLPAGSLPTALPPHLLCSRPWAGDAACPLARGSRRRGCTQRSPRGLPASPPVSLPVTFCALQLG